VWGREHGAKTPFLISPEGEKYTATTKSPDRKLRFISPCGGDARHSAGREGLYHLQGLTYISLKITFPP